MIGKDTPKLMPSFAVKMRIQEVFSAVVELMGKKHAVTTFSVDWNSYTSLSKRRHLEPVQQYFLSPHIENHLEMPRDVAWGFVDEGKFR
jgi:hypothetical protein